MKTIDAHTIVRKYFADSFKAGLPDSWTKGHAVLAKFFDERSIPDPQTLDEAIPLYRSGLHRALSGDLTGAYDYYRSRIVQGERYYSHNVLASYGSDIELLSYLFSDPWKRVTQKVGVTEHSKILRDAAVDWQTLGQFQFASEAMEASYTTARQIDDLVEASLSASYLSELLVIRGKLREAVRYGRESVELGRRSGDPFAYANSLSSAGDALHQIGNLRESLHLFSEGISYQKSHQQDEKWRRHFTLQGYHYCCLQMSRGKPRIVERWCRHQINTGASRSISLLTFALDYIALGRALLASYKAGRGTLTSARDCIEAGVNLVRQSQDISFLPAGLLARAELLRTEGSLAEATQVLDNVTRIAKQGTGMPLYLIDVEIERARLSLLEDEESEDQVLRSITRIEASIQEIGYARRLPDVKELRKHVAPRCFKWVT